MQMITDSKAYGGSNLAVLKTIYKNEGITGFWHGNGINMFRIFPQNASEYGTPSTQDSVTSIAIAMCAHEITHAC